MPAHDAAQASTFKEGSPVVRIDYDVSIARPAHGVFGLEPA
ncbi:MAG TPA: hypothetical protein VFI28_05580 [Candidatus Limnocylindrales bacterium]|nr:hypothetical protein [Candidatus Limnocylindrales bacterium]